MTTTRAQIFAPLSVWSGRRLIMFVCTGHSGQTVIKHAGFMGWRSGSVAVRSGRYGESLGRVLWMVERHGSSKKRKISEG